MPAQLDEEQQEPRSDQSHTQSEKHRCGITHDRQRTPRNQHDQCRPEEDQSRDHLTLQLCIAKHEPPAQQRPQEPAHHHRIEAYRQLHRQQQAERHRDQQQVHKQDGSVRQEETVETEERHIIFRRAEREIHHQHQHQTGYGTARRSEEDHRIVSISQQQQTRQRSQGQGNAPEPARGEVRLRALETLTGIDDQRTAQHHLRHTKGCSHRKAQQQQHWELHKLIAQAVEVIQQRQQGRHRRDGHNTHDVTAITFNQVAHEGTQGKQSCPEGTHHETGLHPTQILVADQPHGHRRQEHIDRHRQQEL